MAKSSKYYLCNECGYQSQQWYGRCPSCREFGTLSEFTVENEKPGRQTHWTGDVENVRPVLLQQLETLQEPRIQTSLLEFDRTVGGGIVPGSVVLLAGDPGIGKSTLMLQVCQWLGERGIKCLYVSGEESLHQLKLRSTRLKAESDNIWAVAENCLERILQFPEAKDSGLLIIDSVQTLFSSALDQVPGSLIQVREVTLRLTQFAKSSAVPVILIGHVTKEGMIAGPKMLEHAVDTVLYFEGDMNYSYRLLRTVKNRFGPTFEVGVFEMAETGLREVKNPSEIFLTRRTQGIAGSVVAPSLEGSRPILIEVQALVASASYGAPRRVAAGLDQRRLALIVAVLEKRLGMQLQMQDVFVNLAGGLKISEPAIDLAVGCAIFSSFLARPVSEKMFAIGEIGLTGEVRPVSQMTARIKEAHKLGYTIGLVAGKVPKELRSIKGLELISMTRISDLQERLFQR